MLLSMADPEALLSEWLGAELERQPTLASELGLEGYDDRLGDFGAARWTTQAHRDQQWTGRISKLSLPDLPLDDQVDLTLILAEMAGRSIMDDWASWRRDPAVYLDPCLDGVFSLWLHRLRPEAALAAASVARLHHIPEVLSAARAQLDADLVSPMLVSRAVNAARGGARYFSDLLPAEVAEQPMRGLLASAAATAATELEDFAVFLEGLERRGRGDWAIGETRYSALLREKELIGVDAAGLHALGQSAYDQLAGQMDELAVRIDPDASGWKEVMADIATDYPSSPDAMRSAYEAACLVARDFLIQHGLVTLPPGEECLVEASPVFQRPVLAVASYIAPPAFSTSVTGHFFVPYPPDGETPRGIAERLADNGHHTIPTVAVHEAYPGHHWHLTTANATPRPVRKVLTTSFFVEGWALYAEAMMNEQGFFTDPRDVLCHLASRLFRAARIVVDTSLHCGAMTVDEAVAFMVDKVLMTEAVARSEVVRYCGWPTQASSYLVGALEIEALRDRWRSEQRGDLRSFHDAVAAHPVLPTALVAKLLFA
jgi:uncharacterized protein (DUF885 family)